MKKIRNFFAFGNTPNENKSVPGTLSQPGTDKTGVLPANWRKPPDWSKESQLELKKKIKKYTLFPGSSITHSRIFLIDLAGEGISSFLKSISIIFDDKTVETGSSEKYRCQQIKDGSKSMNFLLCDLCGQYDKLNAKDYNYFFEGHAEDGQVFDPTGSFHPEIDRTSLEPKLDAKIHCVVFLFEASKIKEATKETWEKANMLQLQMDALGIPRVLLVTKIGDISKAVSEDVTKVFNRKEIEEVVNIATFKLRLPKGNVMPIQNVESNTDPDDKISILTLQALDRILGYANDFLMCQHDKNESGPSTYTSRHSTGNQP